MSGAIRGMGEVYAALFPIPERTKLDVVNVPMLDHAKKGAIVYLEIGDEQVRYRITSIRKHGDGKRFYLKREST